LLRVGRRGRRLMQGGGSAFCCKALRLDLAPARDVCLVLGERGGKRVTARAIGDKIERVRGRWVRYGHERVAAGIADGRRWKAVDLIGVVSRVELDLTLPDHARRAAGFHKTPVAAARRELFADAVNNGGIALKAHWPAQAIGEHRGNL